MHLHNTGVARDALEADMAQELSLLKQVVSDTPPDPLTKPGEGIGIYSPGYKRLGDIEVLVSTLQHTS